MSDMDEGDTPYDGIWCKSCGLEHRDTDETCPHCGGTVFIRRWPHDGVRVGMRRQQVPLTPPKTQSTECTHMAYTVDRSQPNGSRLIVYVTCCGCGRFGSVQLPQGEVAW